MDGCIYNLNIHSHMTKYSRVYHVGILIKKISSIDRNITTSHNVPRRVQPREYFRQRLG